MSTDARLHSPLSIKGRLVRRDFYRIGSVQAREGSRVIITVASHSQYAPDEIKAHLVEIEIVPAEQRNREDPGILDPDECHSMIQALDHLITESERLRNVTLEYAEIDYQTSRGVVVGFSQTGRQQLGYIYVNDSSPYGRAFFEVSGLQQLTALLADALKTLQSLGAVQVSAGV